GFLPGLDLAQSFYVEVIRPRLSATAHSAALIGPGSDVLGYDDLRSTDHYWGPRLQVFVDESDIEAAHRSLRALPVEHRGWPTRIGSDNIAFREHVDVWTITDWVVGRLGLDPRQGMSAADWLAVPQQLLLEATAGRVFHDGLDLLEPLRASLSWYPDDVWRWLLACQWHRIAQEEAFVGRTAESGDELGSRVVAGRIVRDVMRLWLLFERSYAPYSKWLGTAFARLASTAEIKPILSEVLAAHTYPARESALVSAYEAAAQQHNALGITAAQDPAARLYFERPYRVIGADRFANACLETITDNELRALPLVGSVDQWADSTDVLSHPTRTHQLADWYRNLMSAAT
ncbi:MAG: DUF4037 domain-containing protein, partial [Mycobacterium sp.]|nr:DUF4037 domain-containing protein [Mycobacterium sp.]